MQIRVYDVQVIPEQKDRAPYLKTLQEMAVAAAGVENELRNFSSFGTYLE